MEWIRQHPYASILGVAGLLIITMTIVVRDRLADVPQSASTWSIAQTDSSATYRPAQASSTASSHPIWNVVNSLFSKPLAADNSGNQTADDSSFSSLLSRISSKGNQGVAATTSASDDVARAYATVPTAIYSTTTEQARTPAQQELFNYGNDVGAYIRGYERTHPNQAGILKDQIEDRGNATKAAALVSMADGLRSIGRGMERMENVPQGAQGMHKALAQSYIEIGDKLAQVPKAQRDSEVATALIAYDVSVNRFVQRYAALAAYFSAMGVTFSPQDSGSVFSFSTAAS